jgi:hypothetical protein
VPGAIPGLPGLAAFASIKFGGYFLAGIALKKLQPTITASVVKIAATRTGLGILLGPPMTLLGAFVIGLLFSSAKSDMSVYVGYMILLLVRVLVWALVVFVFTKRSNLSRANLWAYATAGAVWSCLLDWPGFKLAMIAPGQIPVC